MFNRFKRRTERTTMLADALEQSRANNDAVFGLTPSELTMAQQYAASYEAARAMIELRRATAGKEYPTMYSYYPDCSTEPAKDGQPTCRQCHNLMTEITASTATRRIFECFVCAAATPIRSCTACNEPLPTDARHCIACGAAVASTGKTERLG